jgi:uncharacterized membrane protein YecN with MAPEG domain
MLPITSLIAGALAFYFVYLAFSVIRIRRSRQVALGAGGVSELEGAIRAHGNFAEYVPFGLLLLGLAEFSHVHSAIVAGLGGVLAVGRMIHARALMRADLRLRVRGMALTFAALVSLGLVNVIVAFRAWLS